MACFRRSQKTPLHWQDSAKVTRSSQNLNSSLMRFLSTRLRTVENHSRPAKISKEVKLKSILRVSSHCLWNSIYTFSKHLVCSKKSTSAKYHMPLIWQLHQGILSNDSFQWYNWFFKEMRQFHFSVLSIWRLYFFMAIINILTNTFSLVEFQKKAFSIFSIKAVILMG